MVEQVREGRAAQRDPQRAHMREIGLRHPPRHLLLREHDLALRPLHGAPGRDVPLQRAHLSFLVASGVLRV